MRCGDPDDELSSTIVDELVVSAGDMGRFKGVFR